MAQRVAGDVYFQIDGQLLEIKRQIRQESGYPYDSMRLKEGLQKLIEGRFDLVSGAIPAFKVWRTLTIGGVPPAKLVKRLTDGNFYVSDWARDLMGKPALRPKPTEVELVICMVGDLGFKEPPTTTDLLARIKEVGNLCPAEVGPHLRLADMNQERGTYYWIAMEPILGSAGDPFVFYVLHSDDGRQWLLAFYAYSNVRWSLVSRVVFCLRK